MLQRSKLETTAGKNWRIFASAAVSVLLFSGSAELVRAADGDLDPTFGIGGKVVTDFSNSSEWLSRIALQPDGKIVAIGESSQPFDFPKFALARYNPDGSLDATFGNGGRVITVIAAVREYAHGLVLLPDGKIMISGSIDQPNESDTSFALLRYNSDGSLDTTFGQGGLVKTNINNDDDRAYALARQSDGKIVAAGKRGIHFYPTEQRKGNVALVRYNPDGSLDATFGNGGIVVNDFGQGLESYAIDVVIQPDGRIIIAGESAYAFLVARYNSNGTLDTTFGNGGFREVNFGDLSWDHGRDAVLQDDGKIIVVGTAEINSPYDSFAVARFNPDGSLDQSFGSGGKFVMVDVGDLEAGALQSDGKLIALGDDSESFKLLRFNLDGSLDSTFGSGGIITTTFGGSAAAGSDLVFQPDGKLLAGGITSTDIYYNNSDFALARYLDGFQLTAAVSRKTHGSAGTFDMNLPLTGQPGVECRNSGGNHMLVFTFNSTIVDGEVSMTSGSGAVSDKPAYAGNAMTVNLNSVTDAQTLTLTLHNVIDTSSRVLPDTTVRVSMLAGDTNGT
ncbi:MAG: hypothetical protein QOC70_2111, partial [Verrucomicrobiota bacterium]